jgi:hypothetical protein
MSAEGNVAAGPEHVGIEGEDAMGPTLVPSHGSLKHKLVNLEKKPMMLGLGVRRLSSVSARKNDVADSDQFGSLNWIGPQMAQEAVPVAVVDADRGAVPRQDWIGWEG